jgi:hypothetical protein
LYAILTGKKQHSRTLNRTGKNVLWLVGRYNPSLIYSAGIKKKGKLIRPSLKQIPRGSQMPLCHCGLHHHFFAKYSSILLPCLRIGVVAERLPSIGHAPHTFGAHSLPPNSRCPAAFQFPIKRKVFDDAVRSTINPFIGIPPVTPVQLRAARCGQVWSWGTVVLAGQ